MRKTIFSALVLSGVVANAQNDYYGRMGLNTETPRATLEVKATSHNKAQGILFPTVTETVKNKWAKDNAKGLVAGTVVWNETKTCLDVFNGTTWSCTDGTKTNTHGTAWTDGGGSGGGSNGGGSGSGGGGGSTQVPQAFADAPWMKLSNGVVNAAGTGFLAYDGTGTLPAVSQVKYMTWNNAMTAYGSTTTFAGGQYSLPTRDEWATILPDYHEVDYTINYTSTNTHNNISETNSLGTFTNDYKNMGGIITYAVRFKGNDDLKSAWKYEYVSGKGLKITIVNLKAISQESATINTVSAASFWSGVPSTAKQEIFLPAYGVDSGYYGHGLNGWFWSSTEYGSIHAWSAHFNSSYAYSYGYDKTARLAVFLVKRN